LPFSENPIIVGSGSPTIMAAIVEREARIREITNQVIEPGPESLEEKLEELRTFAVASRGDLWPFL
jgi:hypothetical protein